jgi:Protein phosphatase 2C.
VVPQIREEKSILASVKKRRNSHVKNKIFPLQLTKDHKPEDPAEYQRIVEAGGRVKRLLNSEGNRIGPYRV